ncbi:MAG: hypothetical protein J0H48_13075 [Nitrosospira multiformis]|nr:hypothetical protein [Nitrosospira multiformis]
MTKDEGWNDEQLLANICKLWKWALILNRLAHATRSAGIAPALQHVLHVHLGLALNQGGAILPR